MKTYGETFLSISRSFLFCCSHNKICDWLQQIFIKFLSISIMNFFHYYKMYFGVELYRTLTARTVYRLKMCFMKWKKNKKKFCQTRNTSIVLAHFSALEHICPPRCWIFWITMRIILVGHVVCVCVCVWCVMGTAEFLCIERAKWYLVCDLKIAFQLSKDENGLLTKFHISQESNVIRILNVHTHNLPFFAYQKSSCMQTQSNKIQFSSDSMLLFISSTRVYFLWYPHWSRTC